MPYALLYVVKAFTLGLINKNTKSPLIRCLLYYYGAPYQAHPSLALAFHFFTIWQSGFGARIPRLNNIKHEKIFVKFLLNN